MSLGVCTFTRGAFVLICLITGGDSGLVVSPTGQTQVQALHGKNVTLGVSVTGVSAPLLTWTRGAVPLASWILGSKLAPNINPQYKRMLSVDHSGSLVLWNVLPSCSGKYTVTVTKPGAHGGSVSFTLVVYDALSSISVDTSDLDAVEGGPAFSLYYISSPGQATSWKWFFNGLKLRNCTRYSITNTSLTINSPSRNDTGQYTVELRNPVSSRTQSKNITVLYGPDQPFLEVSPTNVSFVSGQTLNLTCGAVGEPTPSASWVFQGHTLPASSSGTLKLTNVQPSQSGTYTCVLTNAKTSARLERNITIDVRGLQAANSAIAGIAAGVPWGILLALISPRL
ncbi:carcinoembryonic antigen-related cell adhesion molecule 6-like [Hoplias malabaricus]|uniref:carcinoembryonic antigen-related cell adhesion molecule 6-like n=1 Tax=Hoplias malabaricus TaxID=27720 RepID=UPI003462CE54